MIERRQSSKSMTLNLICISPRFGRRGQSLVVAVIVMFVLLFIGGVFVGLVARNLLNSGRSKDTMTAVQFAEDGVKYADYFLQNSPEGADWRPALTAIVNQNDPDIRWLRDGYSRIDLNGGRALVRVSYGPGLIPDPSSPGNSLLDPQGKYIKIESVGRVGTLNPNDPTTYLNTPSPRLRREYVAFKAIALTDFLRFVTDRNNDTKSEAFLGWQNIGLPVWMQMGGLPLRTFGNLPSWIKTPGAPIWSNSNLRFGNQLTLAEDPRNGDGIYVAGKVLVSPPGGNPGTEDPNQRAARLLDLSLSTATDPMNAAQNIIIQSDVPTFSTFNGILRDASGNPDPTGHARGISRLQPPLIDAVDQATGYNRYRLLTRNSGKFMGNIDLGRVGLGSGIYIDNFVDIEPETSVNDNGKTLRQKWLNPGSSSRWRAYTYAPVGVKVEFGYPITPDRDAAGNVIADSYTPKPGFRIERDAELGDKWRDLQGVYSSQTVLDWTYFIYKPAGQPPVLKLDSEFYRNSLKAAMGGATDAAVDKFLPDFNGVIYAEGNVLLRGLLADSTAIPIRRENAGEQFPLTDTEIRDLVHPSLTVVSGSNLYIEGSVIRESARTMIGMLAVENVVVNTTRFMFPTTFQIGQSSTAKSLETPENIEVDTNGSSLPDPFSLDFQFGENPLGYTNGISPGSTVPINLLLRHGIDPQAPSGGQTFLNLLINRGLGAPPPIPNFLFNYAVPPPLPPVPPQTYPISTLIPNSMTGDNFQSRVFQLYPKDPSATYVFTGDTGYTWPYGMKNTLTPFVDVSMPITSGSGPLPYLITRAAVVPMDVRIEGVMYAQNGSFFIIPGYPFNSKADDSRDQALRRAPSSSPLGSMVRLTNDEGVDKAYPFYNEPIDCRITIVGAISENRTASSADQTAWLKLWGWVPQVNGSTGKNVGGPLVPETQIPQEHNFVNDVGGPVADMRTPDEINAFSATGGKGISRGIRFIYDPALMAPFQGYDPAQRAFRTDFANYDPANPGNRQGRTLPPIPRLPVCPNFVFYGEVR